MHDGIKKSADIGDIKRLKYTFVDSLDVDPTFEEYLDDYNYCADKGLFERHKDLTPFSDRKVDWNDDYWQKIKRDLLKNFSRERLDHMRKVALVVLADKVERLKRERQQTRQPAAVRPASPPPPPIKSKVQQEQEKLEAAKQQLAQENAEVERQQRLQQQELDRQRQENSKQKKEEASPPKKSSGIASKILIGIVAVGAVGAVVALVKEIIIPLLLEP